jgi:hypothetical protein
MINAVTRTASGFTNLYRHTGATYVGGSDASHRLWAAAEIFRLTGSASARAAFDSNWGDSLAFNTGIYFVRLRCATKTAEIRIALLR